MVIAYWILAGLLAVVSIAAGGMKVAQPPAKLAASGLAWAGDFPAWSVKTIGLLEVLGGVGLILPALTGIVPVLSPVAAVALGVVQVGAIITHLVRGEAKMLPANIVLLLLAVAAAWIGFLTWV